MLQDAREKGWEDVVSWAPDGLSFHVHNTERFMTEVLPAYFNQTKFKSFQRQLSNYGFARIANGHLECAYSHRYLIHGNQEMCKNIIRIVGQDKSPGKESSSTSSSPSTLPSPPKALLQQDLKMKPLPSLPSIISYQNDPEQHYPSSGFVNPTDYLSDNLSFPLNFDDTPMSLEDFVSTESDLLFGLEEIISI